MRIKPFSIFIALQAVDIITTLIAFRLGGTEQNPLVASFLSIGAIPGLLLSKAAVIALASLAVSYGKGRRLHLANVAFTLVVVWNLSIISRLAIAA